MGTATTCFRSCHCLVYVWSKTQWRDLLCSGIGVFKSYLGTDLDPDARLLHILHKSVNLICASLHLHLRFHICHQHRSRLLKVRHFALLLIPQIPSSHRNQTRRKTHCLEAGLTHSKTRYLQNFLNSAAAFILTWLRKNDCSQFYLG